MQLSVLHICSDFANQRIYNELVTNLDSLGLNQSIYVPVRNKADFHANCNDRLFHVTYRFAHVLKPLHRLFFRNKIKTIFRDLSAQVDLSKIAVVHAHFLYSDGAVALKIKKEFGIPYIVAVRNTDINAFMKYRPDLQWLCWDIIKQASKIVFINYPYIKILLKKVPVNLKPIVLEKAIIIPNGLSNFWIDNYQAKKSLIKSIKLLYVGDFSRNKNIQNVLLATAMLRKELDIELTLVGDGGDGEKIINKMLASGKYNFVKRLGRINDELSLLSVYRSHHIFIMPSFKETFGVVYLEALSQGLPIIFTQGQGIDGYFETGRIGATVDPDDPEDIKTKILEVIKNIQFIPVLYENEILRFKWKNIANTYLSIYQDVISSFNDLRNNK